VGVATIVLVPLMAVVIPVPAAVQEGCTIGNSNATSAQFLVGSSKRRRHLRRCGQRHSLWWW
jgi:hypothetical protein